MLSSFLYVLFDPFPCFSVSSILSVCLSLRFCVLSLATGHSYTLFDIVTAAHCLSRLLRFSSISRLSFGQFVTGLPTSLA
ncbi:hypothetical protein F5Y14DRAFT_408571 [Nemania sp. NC0429]|nr:hypothetical protein F5Y14DRAFT_408571 [Nemania sp. NC0429]